MKRIKELIDGCITDEQHNEKHEWNIQEDDDEVWWHYFERI